MNEKRFTLRMDGDLFEQISQEAEKNHRSVAKEIEYAVSQYLSVQGRELLWGYVLAHMSDENIAEFIQNIRNSDEFRKMPLSNTILNFVKEREND